MGVANSLIDKHWANIESIRLPLVVTFVSYNHVGNNAKYLKQFGVLKVHWVDASGIRHSDTSSCQFSVFATILLTYTKLLSTQALSVKKEHEINLKSIANILTKNDW